MNYNDLLEDWIIYLKNKGIVKRQSADSGALSYVRRPTKADIVPFLIDSGFSRDDIQSAIQSVIQKTPSLPAEPAQLPPDEVDQPTSPSNDNDTKETIDPGTIIQFPGIADTNFQWGGQQWRLINKKSGKASKIANREVGLVLTKLAKGEDPSAKELLDARKKLGLLASAVNLKNNITEAFVDMPFSETQISAIFTALTNKAVDNKDDAHSKETSEEQKIAEINAIKRSIRDTFTDKQRKALWRILSNA